MATDHATPGDAAPAPTTVEALMAERQIFWALFCRVAFWAILAIGAILVLLDWTLV